MFDYGTYAQGQGEAPPHPPQTASSPHHLDMDALCHSAISDYRSVFDRSNEDHPWSRLPDEDFLARLNAVARPPGAQQLHPTRAGALMFGYEHEIAKLYPGYVLDYRRESKTGSLTKRIVSNDGLWSGCVFDFWQQVAPLLSEAAGERPEGRSRATEPPLCAAAKEGLVNALVHSDYAGRRHLVVVQRADRIEFSNPGSLRVGAADAFEGGIADPRNPFLMKMFALIGACTDAGRGLCMIQRASEKAGVFDPVLSQRSHPDRTTLTVFVPPPASKRSAAPSEERAPRSEAPPPGNEHLASQQAPLEAALQPQPVEEISVMQTAFVPMQAQSADQPQAPPEPRRSLGESEEAVERAMARTFDPDSRAALSLFRDKKRIRRSDVEEALGVGSTKAKAVVAALVAEGIISAEGGGRSTLYRLTDA